MPRQTPRANRPLRAAVRVSVDRQALPAFAFAVALGLVLTAATPAVVQAQEFSPPGPIVPIPDSNDREPEIGPSTSAGSSIDSGPVRGSRYDLDESALGFDPDVERFGGGGASGRGYDVDQLNPLRYLDGAIDWAMTGINGALNDLLDGFHIEPNEETALLYGAYRFRWQDDDLTGFRELGGGFLVRQDEQIATYNAWYFGLLLNAENLSVDLLFQQIQGTGTDEQENLLDLGRFAFTIRGIAGKAIRFPVDFLDTWFRLVLYLGRGPLILGRGRLIGSDDYDLRGGAFDMATLAFVDAQNGGGLALFIGQPTDVIRNRFDETVDRHILAGLAIQGIDPLGQSSGLEAQIQRTLLRPGDRDYKHFPVADPRERRLTAGFDLYGVLLFIDEVGQLGEPTPSNPGEPTSGRTYLWSLGMRASLLRGDWFTLEGEATAQLGERAGNRVEAYFIHAELTLGAPGSIPFAITFLGETASGDRDPTDGVQQGYDTLYPIRRGRLGLIDLFGMRNIVHYAAILRVEIDGALGLLFGAHVLRSATSADGIFGPGRGDVLLTPLSGRDESRTLGIAWEGAIEYHYSERVRLRLSVSQFVPGKRFTDRGVDDRPVRLDAAAEIRF